MSEVVEPQREITRLALRSLDGFVEVGGTGRPSRWVGTFADLVRFDLLVDEWDAAS